MKREFFTYTFNCLCANSHDCYFGHYLQTLEKIASKVDSKGETENAENAEENEEYDEEEYEDVRVSFRFNGGYDC